MQEEWLPQTQTEADKEGSVKNCTFLQTSYAPLAVPMPLKALQCHCQSFLLDFALSVNHGHVF